MADTKKKKVGVSGRTPLSRGKDPDSKTRAFAKIANTAQRKKQPFKEGLFNDKLLKNIKEGYDTKIAASLATRKQDDKRAKIKHDEMKAQKAKVAKKSQATKRSEREKRQSAKPTKKPQDRSI